MLGNVLAIGFGWELLVVSLLALARKAASQLSRGYSRK